RARSPRPDRTAGRRPWWWRPRATSRPRSTSGCSVRTGRSSTSPWRTWTCRRPRRPRPAGRGRWGGSPPRPWWSPPTRGGPGGGPTSVAVRLFGPDGEIEHESLKDLDVPPAASAALSLEGPLGEQPATVLVESDHPVVAGVLAEREGGDDSAYSAAVPALEEGPGGTAAVPADPDGTSTELLVGAVEQDASLIVTPVAEDGTTADPMKVEVAAGATAEVEVDAPKGPHALLMELRDGSGPVHAAAVLTQGKGK